MAKLIDLTGKKFDKLTVLEKAPSRKRHVYWKCKCDCGNIIERSSEYLKKENLPRNCGCSLKKNIKIKEKEKRENYLIGKKFGKLTVIKPTKERMYNSIVWECKCECGNIKYVPTVSLTNGHTKSCGCLKLDSHLINIVGQKFGKLTPLYFKDKKWHCKCDCGNECDVDSYYLRHLITQSCGCILRSIGETNIENILRKYKINFITEYSFDDLINKETNRKYRFDFAIFNSNNKVIRLIEFDGEQHTNKARGTWKNHEPLEKIQERDNIKNKYAKEHNIPLVRIPYFEKDNITLDMIMGDQYLMI